MIPLNYLGFDLYRKEVAAFFRFFYSIVYNNPVRLDREMDIGRLFYFIQQGRRSIHSAEDNH